MGEIVDTKKRLVLGIVLTFGMICLLLLMFLTGCEKADTYAKPGCDVSGTYLDCDKWSVCQDKARERTCRDMVGCLEKTSFKQVQNCEISVKTGELRTGPPVAEFCTNDGVCDKGENFHLCPNDCSANAIDKICNNATNSVCDPDCSVSDKDCIPIVTGFSPELTSNFSSYPNLRNAKGVTLGMSGKGIIKFTSSIDVLGLNLNEDVSIDENSVSYSDLLNASAEITLFGLEFVKPAILFGGVLCKSCKIRSYKNNTIEFTAPGPGVYSAKEASELTESEKERAKKQEEGPQFYQTKKFTIVIIIILAVLIVLGAFYAFFKNITFHIKLPKREEAEKKAEPPPQIIEIKPYAIPEEKEEKRSGKKKGKKEKISVLERKVIKAKPKPTKIVKRTPKNPHKVVEVMPRKDNKKKATGSRKTLIKITFHAQKAKKMFKEGYHVVKQKDLEYEKKLKEDMKKEAVREKQKAKRAKKERAKAGRKAKRKPAKKAAKKKLKGKGKKKSAKKSAKKRANRKAKKRRK